MKMNLKLNLNDNGTLQFSAGVPGEPFRPAIVLDGISENLEKYTLEKKTENELVLTGRSGRTKWIFSARTVQNAVQMRLQAELQSPVKEFKLVLFSQNQVKTEHILAQNYSMGGCVSIHFPVQEPSDFCGHHFAVLKNGGEYLMFSFPLCNRLMSDFSGTAKNDGIGNFTCSAGTNYEDLLMLDSGIMTVESGSDPFRMMDEWSSGNLEIQKDFTGTLTPGWNSWDYYRWTVTEDEVLKNAAAIAEDPVLSRYVKRIIIDDGWQYCYGEWDANPYFPHGMKWLAEKLISMGFEPGLWIAPSIAEPHSRIAQYTPDEMMALGRNGHACLAYECMRRYGFVLDPTVEKSRKFIRDLFDRYASMGYRYFKLDFLYCTLNAPQFHDRTVPKTQIVRKIVEAAAEGIRDRAQILGCNYAYSAGNKNVFAVRIGGDIHSNWNGIRRNSVSVAGMMWAAEKQWRNDPDFSLCRSYETADDPDQQKIRANAVFNAPEDPVYASELNESLMTAHACEIEVLLSLVLVSAGAINLSDKMTRLNEKGLFLARKVVSSEHGKPGKPLDMFEADYTRTWVQQVGKAHRVLLINWTDAPEERVFDPAERGICGEASDFWKEKPLPLENGILKVNIPPHSCVLAVFENA